MLMLLEVLATYRFKFEMLGDESRSPHELIF